MPDNSWYTRYKFPPSECLSSGPSQGIVYQLPEDQVIKLPYQYPVGQDLPRDQIEDQISMSFRSFACFERESTFYDNLSPKLHANLAQRLPSPLAGIVLEKFQPVAKAWGSHGHQHHNKWILGLASALEWLEDIGFMHGDIKIQNMGIDHHGRLKLFDFGSVVHCDEDGYADQVVEDHFNFATCVHFLASGVDPFEEFQSRAEVQQAYLRLQEGRGIIHDSALRFKRIIESGWTTSSSPPPQFSRLRMEITDIVTSTGVDVSKLSIPSTACPMALTTLMERDIRWMEKEEYRAAWDACGYQSSG